jgi:hypothetical protein
MFFLLLFLRLREWGLERKPFGKHRGMTENGGPRGEGALTEGAAGLVEGVALVEGGGDLGRGVAVAAAGVGAGALLDLDRRRQGGGGEEEGGKGGDDLGCVG